MNVRRLGLVVVFTSILIVGAGCNPKNANILAGNPDRVVTISEVNPGASNPCEVDFPVAQVTKHKNQTIAWAAADHDYWIQFANNSSPIGSVNIPVPSPKKTKGYSIAITITPPSQYFMYAIYDVDPTTSSSAKPCKDASDDRDTGLNVKP